MTNKPRAHLCAHDGCTVLVLTASQCWKHIHAPAPVAEWQVAREVRDEGDPAHDEHEK